MNLTQVENIGHGGFGVVDKVIDEYGNYFAKKTFQVNQGPNFSPDLVSNVKKRFIREASVQEGIVHPNIVPVIAKDLYADVPSFLMPLASSTLENDIRANRNLNGSFIQAILDIISGLEELHSMDIYHRDLKPANVLRLEETGPDGNLISRYAIGDFGLMSINQTNLSNLTQTGMRMGSDFYTAPEIVKELKNASAQSDIYSLGCILHDFIGIDERVMCNEIKEESEFGGILLNCTRKDPARRFKSVTALRDAILALGNLNIEPSTPKGANVFSLLEKEEDQLEIKEWDEIVTFIEDEYDSEDAVSALKFLTLAHITQLLKVSPKVGARLGVMYARWIRESSFNFDHCDALAIRLKKFIEECNIETQSECLMSLLYLGTSHNRFYVERKFISLVGANMNPNLAKRIALELRVEGKLACDAINHLVYSINYNISNLHPLLLKTLQEVCK
jgi:eukaryotic-like serine/threonine-protein kinase